jgi:Lon protease-like protein
MILSECNLFPEALLPLFIFEPRYRTMLAEALESHRMFCISMQRPGTSRETPCEIAGLGLIRASMLNENGTSNLVLQGVTRVRLGKMLQHKPYRVHQIEVLESEAKGDAACRVLAGQLIELVESRLRQGVVRVPITVMKVLTGTCPDSNDELTVDDCVASLQKMEDPGTLADVVAMMLVPDALVRQILLQTLEVEERLTIVSHFLKGEVARFQKKST